MFSFCLQYLLQSDQTSFQPVIVLYQKLTNEYTTVCTLNLGTGNDLGFTALLNNVGTYEMVSFALIITSMVPAASSIDPTNNFYVIAVNDASIPGSTYGSVIITVDLNSCTQYVASFDPSYLASIGGPEFSYQ